MPSLMPLSERSLTFPVALLAGPPRALPLWLRACVEAGRVDALSACDAHAARPDCEECGHEYRAALEIVADVWLDALCPRPMFGDWVGVFTGCATPAANTSFDTTGRPSR